MSAPGTGLSYTHATPWGSADHGQSGATEGAEMPKGVALRGWLWTTALGVVLVAVAFGLSSCGASMPPPAQGQTAAVATPLPTLPAAADPRIAYELKEKCGRDAREWFQHFYGDGKSHTKDFLLTDYQNHYQAKMNGCFAVTISFSTIHDSKTHKVKGADSRSLINVAENRDLGSFFKFSDMQAPMTCSVLEQTCASSEEWETLTRRYMEE